MGYIILKFTILMTSNALLGATTETIKFLSWLVAVSELSDALEPFERQGLVRTNVKASL